MRAGPGFAGHPVLNCVIDELTRESKSRQIIIGDPSPKNIALQSHNGGLTFTFYDLEDVHRGHVAFDVGFLIGHVILHSHANTSMAIAQVAAFRRGYRLDSLDVASTRWVKPIALGAILYRIDSIVPYGLRPAATVRQRLSSAARRVLRTTDLESADWSALIRGVLEPV